MVVFQKCIRKGGEPGEGEKVRATWGNGFLTKGGEACIKRKNAQGPKRVKEPKTGCGDCQSPIKTLPPYLAKRYGGNHWTQNRGKLREEMKNAKTT